MDPLGTYPGDRIDRSIQMIKSSCGPGGYPTNQSVTVRGWWKVIVLLCLFVFDVCPFGGEGFLFCVKRKSQSAELGIQASRRMTRPHFGWAEAS